MPLRTLPPGFRATFPLYQTCRHCTQALDGPLAIFFAVCGTCAQHAHDTQEHGTPARPTVSMVLQCVYRHQGRTAWGVILREGPRQLSITSAANDVPFDQALPFYALAAGVLALKRSCTVHLITPSIILGHRRGPPPNPVISFTDPCIPERFTLALQQHQFSTAQLRPGTDNGRLLEALSALLTRNVPHYGANEITMVRTAAMAANA